MVSQVGVPIYVKYLTRWSPMIGVMPMYFSVSLSSTRHHVLQMKRKGDDHEKLPVSGIRT